jgi:SPT2 chromatin protein
MEAGYDSIQEEELISAQIAEQEDAQELELIMAAKRRKRERRRERKRQRYIAEGRDLGDLSED